MSKMFRFCVLNGPNACADPLGGPVGRDNAAITLMTTHFSGHPIDELEIAESQVREATTADRKTYSRPQMPNRAEVKLENIRYRVTRVS